MYEKTGVSVHVHNPRNLNVSDDVRTADHQMKSRERGSINFSSKPIEIK